MSSVSSIILWMLADDVLIKIESQFEMHVCKLSVGLEKQKFKQKCLCHNQIK